MGKKIRTNVILGRNYGPAVESDGTMHYMPPANYLMAKAMLMKPSEVLSLVREYPDYKLSELKALESGEKWTRIKPAFLPSRRHIALLQDPKKLEERFIKKVKQRDGTLNLIESSGKDTINNSILYGSGVLSANVKSLSSRSATGGNQAYHKVKLNGLGLDEYDKIKYRDRHCDCSDFSEEEEKFPGLRENELKEEEKLIPRVHCKHINVAEILFDQEIRGINTGLLKKAGGNLPEFSAMPYSFFDVPSRHVKHLLGEVLISYYVFNNNLFDINLKLSDMKGIYRNHTLKMAENGELTFRARRQRNVTLPYLTIRQKASALLVKEARQRLQEDGFTYDGVCVEFKGTLYQNIAQRYIKDNKVITIATSLERPPLFTEKRLEDKIDVFGNKLLEEDPFLKLYSETRSMYKTIDDVTRRECRERIFIPGSYGAKKRMDVPYVLRQWYKETIRQAKKSQKINL